MATYNQIHRYGTQAQYDALVLAGTVNENYLYFTSDTGKLYKGSVDITNSLIKTAANTAVPATGVAGKIYLESSTGMVKAYIDGAWVVLSYPISQSIPSGSSTGSTYAVPSEAAVKEYVDSAIGATGVVSNIEQKMNGSTAVAGTLVATKNDGSTFDIRMTGLTTKPTWDAETRVLSFPVTKADGTTETVTANIGKDIFLDPGEGKNYFDPDTQEIVLTLNDDPDNPTVIRIPASALYNDYTAGDTATIDMDIDGTTHEITASVKIDDTAGNALQIVTNKGLRVDLSAYATTASVEGIRSNLQGQIDSTTATLAATTESLSTLTNNYNATTTALSTLQSNYNNTTADLDALKTNYNATTVALNTLTNNYNATTADLATLKTNYNNTTAALNTLTTNYNATTVTVAQNSADITALATAATEWAGFAES